MVVKSIHEPDLADCSKEATTTRQSSRVMFNRLSRRLLLLLVHTHLPLRGMCGGRITASPQGFDVTLFLVGTKEVECAYSYSSNGNDRYPTHAQGLFRCPSLRSVEVIFEDCLELRIGLVVLVDRRDSAIRMICAHRRTSVRQGGSQ